MIIKWHFAWSEISSLINHSNCDLMCNLIQTFDVNVFDKFWISAVRNYPCIFYFSFDYNCLKFTFNFSSFSSTFCFYFLLIWWYFFLQHHHSTYLLTPCHFSHAMVTLLHSSLSFPFISLCLVNLTECLLLTLPPCVSTKLTYCSVLNYPQCEKNLCLIGIWRVAGCAHWLSSFRYVSLSNVWHHLFHILPLGSWRDIWSQLNNTCSKGYFQKTACEQFAEVLWGIFSAIK